MHYVTCKIIIIMADVGDISRQVGELTIGDNVTWNDVFDLKKLLTIAHKLGHDWKRVAGFLGFERPEIENFEANSHTQEDSALYMLTRYRDGCEYYKSQRQIKEFLEGLSNARRKDLVHLITGETVADLTGNRPFARAVADQEARQSYDKYPEEETHPPEPTDAPDEPDCVLFCDPQFYNSKKKDPNIYPPIDDNSKPRGFAVIINFTKNRDGSMKDVELMKSLFTQLNYNTDLLIIDEKKEEIMRKLKDIAKDGKLREHDSIVIFLMAHGQADQIFDIEEFPIYYQELFEVFQAKYCPYLEGKPKLFFFQSCRGVSEEYHTKNEQSDAVEIENVPITSRWSDMLISHATVPGHKAYRNTETGSSYPNAIWEVFKRYARNTHVLDLLTRVNAHMHDPKNLHFSYDHQTRNVQAPVRCAEKTSTLRKDFYFFPRAVSKNF